MVTRYEFPSMVARDPTLDVTVKNGVGLIYAPGDITFSSPLTALDRYGVAKGSVKCTPEGLTEEFYVDGQPVVWWASGDYAFLISSFTGMLAAAELSQTAAENAQLAAEAAARAAQTLASGVAGTTDLGVSTLIRDFTSQTRAALDAVFAAVGMVGRTVDTQEIYKAIMLSDGTVRAVPEWVVAPVAPTGLSAVIGPTSARLTWNAVPDTHHYTIFKNLDILGTTTGRVFRHDAPAGSRFTYQVSSTNNYGMRSPLSPGINVYMDPALNAPPTCQITTWPPTIPTAGNGSAIVRVNAVDMDIQTVAMSLSVDAGTLTATRDPSIWILTL